MQKRFVVRATAVAVVLAALAAVVTTWSGPAVARPYGDVIRACEDENQRKPGACQKNEADIGVLHGCADSACFVCPTTGRMCWPATDGAAGGVIHGKTDVTLSSDGVDVKALTDACDANADGGGKCDYKIDSMHVIRGRTTESGVQFECVDDKECHQVN